jgi:recombination protein RecT
MTTPRDLKPQAATPPADVNAMRPKDAIAYLLDKRKGEIAKMLPKHLTADRLLKVATIAATTTPALAKCDVPSLVAAIGQCAQMGLEPNTVLGHAYLVPFNTKRKVGGVDTWVNSVQVIIGYRGLIDLARRSGQIVSISAHEVCERDTFAFEYGLFEKLKHIPAMKDRGEIIGFYAVAKLVGGGHSFEFMSREQVEEIREASQGYQQAVKFKKEQSHPWRKHFAEMGRKTAIRRLAKYLPLSIEMADALAIDGKVAEAPALDDGKTVDGEMTWLDGDANDEYLPPADAADDPLAPPFDREPGADDAESGAKEA